MSQCDDRYIFYDDIDPIDRLISQWWLQPIQVGLKNQIVDEGKCLKKNEKHRIGADGILLIWDEKCFSRVEKNILNKK